MSVELLIRRAQSELRLRPDQIHHRFRLSQIKLAVEKRALRKFSRIGHPGSCAQQQIQQPASDQYSPVTTDLNDILSGVTGRSSEKRDQHVIYLNGTVM